MSIQFETNEAMTPKPKRPEIQDVVHKAINVGELSKSQKRALKELHESDYDLTKIEKIGEWDVTVLEKPMRIVGVRHAVAKNIAFDGRDVDELVIIAKPIGADVDLDARAVFRIPWPKLSSRVNDLAKLVNAHVTAVCTLGVRKYDGKPCNVCRFLRIELQDKKKFTPIIDIHAKKAEVVAVKAGESMPKRKSDCVIVGVL